jgi:NAD(P)-dependent dehydrogenase (short-subunit alcohol dehydrogenase family)
MDLALTNKVALVTGSHRGTGQIIAKTLLQEGASVLVHGMTQAHAEASIEQLGAGTPVWGDIVSSEGTIALLEQCDAFEVSILINNFGAADSGTWLSQGEDDWLLAYQKNVLSAQRLITGMLPKLTALPWARIINLGTVGSTSPNARMPGYYAAKGALANMTIGLAKEVAGSNIRVNLVSPGMIHTPEVEQSYMQMAAKRGWGDTWEEVEAHVAKDIPIRRISRREEVAALVAYLCSPMADAIHGQNIRIDGGQLGIVD